VAAVDEHGSHHVGRRDRLDVVHRRQLDLLTTARTKEEEEEELTFSETLRYHVPCAYRLR